MPLKNITCTLPAPWASYLINGDASGLDDGEQAIIDGWLAAEKLPAPVSCSDESWFARHHDAFSVQPLGGDVMDFTFLLP